ncbi:MAG: hypothetical protein EHM84_04585 [Lysobacterales bacterium]|nr:MAG: hypothetical protein EHM84_04585 [Xanthomonadales bacterium]
MDHPQLIPLSAVFHELHRFKPPDLVEWLHVDRDDAQAQHVVKRVNQKWATWPNDLRWRLLGAIDRIVQAENAKDTWKTRDSETTRRYEDLARSAVRAAEFAKDLATRFPPPWDENTRSLLMPVVEWAVSGLKETSTVDRDFAIKIAAHTIAQLRDDLKAAGKRMPFALIGELATLACGRETVFSESTIRRYGEVTRTLPAANYWREHFDVMMEIGRLVPGAERSERFCDLMHAFLQPPRPH